MTKKINENVIILFLISLLLFTLSYPTLIIKEVEEALLVFITKYFPAVFPIYIITDLLINYHFPLKLAQVCKGICTKFFHVDSTCAFIIIMSMISGFPSGAKYIKEMLTQKIITDDSANYLITFTHFSNPLFILGTCFLITKDRPLTICILISHFLANIVIARVVRPKKLMISKVPIKSPKKESFVPALTTSIYKTFQLMFLILGTSILFFVLSGIIYHLTLDNPYQYLITGLLELTKGITLIPKALSPLGKGVAILLFLSFGSLSIHMQVLSIIKDTKIKYQNFLLGRISQVALSILIFYILSNFFFI